MSEPRPNIVYIMTDQQSADALSAAGNPLLHTPAMDRLAAEGLRCETAYAAYPLCVPARTAMFAGHTPHEMGIYMNVAETPDSCPFPMLGRHLADAGYRTPYIGKWHLTVPEDATDQHGFESITFGGGVGGMDCDKADAAAAFLDNPPAEPFFLTVAFNNPHDACELARGDPLRMEDLPPWPDDDELPPLPDNFEPGNDEPEALRVYQRENPGVGCAPHWDAIQTRRFRWGYFRLVEMVDKEIGKVLDALQRNGLRENTLIVFTSDHGDGQGAHRWNQKWCHYDESARVPFIFVDPARRRAGEVEHQPVNATLDLYPTLCEYAQVDPPADLRGCSVRPLLAGEPLDREHVVSEVSFGNWGELHDDTAPKARMVRTPRYKYIAYETGEHREQLFDMDDDPGEMTNLAGDPTYADIRADHRRRLRDWCAETGDTLTMPTG